MLGLAAHKHWDLIKYVFFIPFYWLLMSFAAIKAFNQLIFNPHYWEKTNHGLHLPQSAKSKKVLHAINPANLLPNTLPSFSKLFLVNFIQALDLKFQQQCLVVVSLLVLH
jgi:hypothetical protein